jgi:hypothetical protein
MFLDEKTFGFKFLITVDRLFNVCTGGSLQECFSTRAYIQSRYATSKQKTWIKVRKIIDKLFWEDHCKESFKWEMQLKRTYVAKYKHLED